MQWLGESVLVVLGDVVLNKGDVVKRKWYAAATR